MTWATVEPTDIETLRKLYERHIERFKLARRQRERYLRGLEMLLAWLRPRPGQSWQQVWELHEKENEVIQLR